MKKHVVCFGDSNTHGYCAQNGGRYGEDERWTCLLQKNLGDEYLILEEGLSGRTTCFSDPIHEGLNGLDYIYPCLMSHEPVDLLIIMLGTNDTKFRFGASSACIGLGMKRLVQKAKAACDAWSENGPQILIVAPKNIESPYVDTEVGATMGPGCAEKSEGLPKEYEGVARITHSFFFDANTVVRENNRIDFMHLTAEGHRQLADGLAGRVREILSGK